jgi:glycosyltransferase 2 family protein
MSADTREVEFIVGSGLSECDAGGLIEISVADGTEKAPACDLSSLDKLQSYPLVRSDEQKEGQSNYSVCLPEGTYTLTIDSTSEDLSIAVKGVDRTEELMRDMARANWWGIVVSIILGYLAIASRGMRWLLMLEPMGYKPKMWNSIHAVAFAYFANTFVPRSGEIARCGALNQTDNIPVDKLFGTVISERVIDFVMLFIFTTLAIVTNLEAFQHIMDDLFGQSRIGDSGSPWMMYLGLAAVIGLAIIIVLRKRIQSTGLYKKVVQFLLGVAEGLKAVMKMKRRALFVFHTFFIWTMYFLMAFVIYKSIDATSSMSVFDALFVMVAGGFGMVLPAPGGIGSYHWAVKLGFIALGLSGTLGFAVANVIWLTQTGMIIVGGGVGYLFLVAYQVKRDRALESKK